MDKYVVPLLIVTAMGSIVDCFQFFWIVRAGWAKIKKAHYERVKAEVLKDLREQEPKIGFEEG